MILTNLIKSIDAFHTNLLIGFILGPDRNSGSGPLRYPFQWNLGWYRFRAPSSSLAGSRAPLQFPD